LRICDLREFESKRGAWKIIKKEMAGQNQGPNMDQFEAYFRRADLDGDGRISGAEAVGFFQGSNLPKQVLAQVPHSFHSSNFHFILYLYK
jgi:hypothetical protein